VKIKKSLRTADLRLRLDTDGEISTAQGKICVFVCVGGGGLGKPGFSNRWVNNTNKKSRTEFIKHIFLLHRHPVLQLLVKINVKLSL
jgi:hypothetical protein